MLSRTSVFIPAALISMVAALALTVSSCTDADTSEIEAGTERPTGTAILQFDDTVFDFGSAYQRQELNHTFVCTNVGDGPIRITRVKPTCGCTIPRFSDEVIAPGEQGRIDVTFQAGTMTGPIDKKMRVFVDAPDVDDVELTVRGEVKVEFWVDPTQTDFGRLFGGSNPEPKNIRISWLNDIELNVTSVMATADSVKILSQTPFEKKKYSGIDVSVQLTDWEQDIDAARTDQYHQFVVIKTDHPRYPQTTHPVTGRFVRAVTATPRVVNFGVVRTASPTTQRFRLNAQPGVDLEILGYDAPDYFEFSMEPATSSGKTDIVMKLLPNAPEGSIKEHVKIRTNVPAQPEVSIYVLANVKND